MSARPSRPQLEAPDLSPPVRRPGEVPPKTAPDDPRFAAAEHLETHAALLQGVQAGRVRVVNPDTAPPDPVLSGPPRRRSPETSLSTKVPDYVMQQLRRRYAESGVTIRNQILLALRKDGLAIADDDILDERKRAGRA